MATLDGRSTLRSPKPKKRSSFPLTSLDSVHVFQAIQCSSDDGATLIFSKMNLSDVDVSAIEELATIGTRTLKDESPVKRITLGGNHLTALPTEFALLSSLRYLNLKHNNFSIFPDVLTSMPSLDTLDISHNKIKHLPSKAGQLTNLRVFCLSRNQIARLPSYFSRFRNLEVLQIERNPIDWPPKYITEQASGLEAGQSMKDWVRSLQKWMEIDSRERINEESGYTEPHDLDVHIEESYNSWKFPIRDDEFDAGVTPHIRSLSIDSNFSLSSVADSIRDVEMSSSSDNQTERHPLHLDILGTSNIGTLPPRSSESYLLNPAESESFDHNPTTNIPYSKLKGAGSVDLVGKKSMPDLRTAKLNFTKKIPEPPDMGPPTTNTVKDRSYDDFSILPPPSRLQDLSPSPGSIQRLPRSTIKEPDQMSPSRAIPSMAFERNSYFQRLSTLPGSTTLPKPLICLIESARSILFAMCQVHQTLEHYIVHAIDDRISSVLRKVLDPASADMIQLINSLDRFDAMSRKMLPPPAICRSVVESCRDTVAVFGKAVGVLALQLKVILTGDDDRYSRWILLELYAATAEVSYAWHAMIPQMDLIKPLLHPKKFSGQPSLALNVAGSENYLAPPALSTTTVSVSLDPSVSLRPHLAVLGAPALMNVGRVRTARRHAGSFSSKDVEIGKTLPSYDDVPGSFGGVVSGVATHTPTLRMPKKQTTIPLTAFPSPPSALLGPTSTLGESSSDSHYRQTSLQTSSPSLPSKTTFLELPSNSKTQVDKEALQAVQAAVEVAPVVWDMMEDMLGDVLNTKTPVRETIDKARAITARLSDTVRTMYVVDAVTDRKVLREDAHMFLKMVVQLSNIIKTYGRPHAVSSALRTNMVKLTNSTEEFAILLHVSSFSLSIHRPHTPVLGISTAQTNPAGPDESYISSSLSRSRSRNDQPSASFRLPPASQHDDTGNVLLAESSLTPGVRRLRSRDNRTNITDPG